MKKNIVGLDVDLSDERADLEQEDDSAGFLWVHSECNAKTGFLNIMQKNLIKSILETPGLVVETVNWKWTPVEGKPLAKLVHRETVSDNFNCSGVVGMLLYYCLTNLPWHYSCSHLYCMIFVLAKVCVRIHPQCYLYLTAKMGYWSWNLWQNSWRVMVLLMVN